MVTMCKYLSELLGTSEPLLSHTLKRLEQASGGQSVDVRLTAEIIGKAHHKLRELGLDPKDTTEQELYHALMGLVKQHDEFLARYIGGKDAGDVQDILPRLKATIDESDMPKKVWALRASVAKRLVKAMPPKHVMKHLGYKSVDSMLKRESVSELYAALRIGEDVAWMNNFLRAYKKLKPSDFESRDLEVLILDDKRWGRFCRPYVERSRHNLTHLKELGVIAILPMPVKKLPGITLAVLPLLLHYINEIRLYSAYFKFQQVKSDFGNILVDTLINDPSVHATIAGQDIHWRIIHRHFGHPRNDYHPEMFEPHLQLEDLRWQRAEEILFRMEPALHFWKDMDYIGTIIGGELISFSLMDNAINHVNKLAFPNRTVHHMRESLRSEIFSRYMEQKTLERHVLGQLDNGLVGHRQLVGAV